MDVITSFFQNNIVLTGFMGVIGGLTGILTLGYTVYFNRKDCAKLKASISSITLNKPNSGFLDSSNSIELNLKIINTGKREASLNGTELFVKKIIKKNGETINHKEMCVPSNGTDHINKAIAPGRACFLELNYGYGEKEIERCLHASGKLTLIFANHKRLKLNINQASSN